MSNTPKLQKILDQNRSDKNKLTPESLVDELLSDIEFDNYEVRTQCIYCSITGISVDHVVKGSGSLLEQTYEVSSFDSDEAITVNSSSEVRQAMIEVLKI